MKKLFASVSSAVASATCFVGSALAIAIPSVPGLSGSADLKTGIRNIITLILDIILIIAVLFIIIAGIRLIVSGGDEGEKDKAKTTILYVAAGIIVLLLARVIVSFVAGLL